MHKIHRVRLSTYVHYEGFLPLMALFVHYEGGWWLWTQGHLATMLRTHPYLIPDDWPLRPGFSLWPPQRHGAVLWVLAYFVYYTVQYPATPTLQDFADFMRRARWKAHPCHSAANGSVITSPSWRRPPLRSAREFYVTTVYRQRLRKSPPHYPQ